MNNKKPYLFRNPEQEDYRIHAGFHRLSGTCELHWHNFLELEIVVAGEAEQFFNGKHQHLQRGVISLVRLTDYHEILPTKEITILNISFDERLISPALLAQIYGTKTVFFDNLSHEEFTTLEKLGELLIIECRNGNADLTYVQHLLDSLFIKLLRFRSAEGEAPSPNAIQTIVQHVRNHFRENPSLAEIAATFGYNSDYLSSLFHKETGVCYTDYLLNLKLQYARSLLRNTGSNIEYIGYQCGFGSYASFRRAFQRAYGISPGDYRKKHR